LIKSGCWCCKNRKGTCCSRGSHKDNDPFYFIDSTWKDVQENIADKPDKAGVVVGSGCINLTHKFNHVEREKVEFS
jgi:hypothetical protein